MTPREYVTSRLELIGLILVLYGIWQIDWGLWGGGIDAFAYPLTDVTILGFTFHLTYGEIYATTWLFMVLGMLIAGFGIQGDMGRWPGYRVGFWKLLIILGLSNTLYGYYGFWTLLNLVPEGEGGKVFFWQFFFIGRVELWWKTFTLFFFLTCIIPGTLLFLYGSYCLAKVSHQRRRGYRLLTPLE